MLIKNLGDDFVVVDKAGEIEYVAPGRGTVSTTFRVTEEDLAAIRDATSDGQKHLAWFTVDVRGPDDGLVAKVRKQLYIRRRPHAAAGQEPR
jgi:hypothetical protein